MATHKQRAATVCASFFIIQNSSFIAQETSVPFKWNQKYHKYEFRANEWQWKVTFMSGKLILDDKWVAELERESRFETLQKHLSIKSYVYNLYIEITEDWHKSVVNYIY